MEQELEKRYISNNGVARGAIALDIKNGRLTKTQVVQLMQDKRVRDSYFGSSYKGKTDQDSWTLAYLETVSYAAIAESFNDDYLFHLYEVAKYVRDKQNRNFKYIVIAAVVVVVIALLMFIK